MKTTLTALFLMAALSVQAEHLKLVWDSNAESDQVTQYNVYQFDNSETNQIGTALTNEFILDDMEPGKTSFYVTAENLWGESEPSNTVTTPQDLPGPPGQLRIDGDL